MSEWLKIVKKHSKLNPGKSLKDFLPDAQSEYKLLKKSGKVVLKTTMNVTKKVFGKKHKKHKKHKSKHKKEQGGSKDNIGTDDAVADVDSDSEENVDEIKEVDYSNDNENEEGGEDEKEKKNMADDKIGRDYKATILLRGRTRAGGGWKKCGGKKGGGRRGNSKGSRRGAKKGGKKPSVLHVSTSQMLAAAPMAQSRSRGRTRAKAGRRMKHSRTRKSRGIYDIIDINLK